MDKKILMILIVAFLMSLVSYGYIVAKTEDVLSLEIKLEDGSIIIGSWIFPTIILIRADGKNIRIKTNDILSIKRTSQETENFKQNTFSHPADDNRKSYWKLGESHSDLLCLSTGKGVEGDVEFGGKLIKILKMSIHTRPSLAPIGKDLKWLDSNTILLIHPEDLKHLQGLESECPQLLPLSYVKLESQLESYPSPLFYFSRDTKVNKIRGVIIIEKVNSELAQLLSEGVPSNIFFRYENGQLQILK
jgi:hypothetical protein